MVRRRINDGLPKYCQRRSYGVIYQPYLGRENGKSVWGKAVNLGPENMPVTDVWAAYEHEPSKGKTHEDIYKEAIQVAAMAIRVATEGDPNFPYDPESGYRGPAWEGYLQNPGSTPEETA